ncbi:MAG: pyrroloquinoline quinone precursor peptide PqqA [Rhizobacter sp.]|nr:pyrroloquinoline quinone precursor peptide PqqA [Rhizobacter sp.]MBP6268221.1 pyrroloquinoline quinone precursor peptide PqqA [Rhizobacter sp.]
MRRSRRHRPEPATHCKEIHMTWTTPSAADFRFGFEITMYVAAR